MKTSEKWMVMVSLVALAGLVAAPLIFIASRPVTGNAKGPALIPVLGMAGRAMLLWAVVTALALALG